MAYSPMLMDILAARGISNPEGFLAEPSWNDVEPPSAYPGITEAVSLILSARERGDTVAVLGDRDCDGVCATAIMMSTLSALGMKPLVHIPHRDEGYGVSREVMHRFGQSGVRLLICVDNGITAVEELYLAQRLGMHPLVIDHHTRADIVPDCPVVWDSRHCASTLAMLTSWAVLEVSGARRVQAWRASLNRLATIAAIADCIPMVGQARVLTRLGMRDLAKVSNGGLRALLRMAGVKGMPTSSQLAYYLSPIVNSAGRMRSPIVALNMLIEKDRHVAEQHALTLITINRERQEVQRQCMVELSAVPSQHPGIQVISSDKWPRGIIGILAGRAVDLYKTPCVVLAPSAEAGVYSGSGRSVAGFSLVDGFAHCSDLLEKFGGHPMAAGLTIRSENIDAFRKRLQAYVDANPPAQSGEVRPEGELHLPDRDTTFNRTLLAMEPFGSEMRPPRLFIGGLTVVRSTATKAQMEDANGNKITAFVRGHSLSAGQALDAVCEVAYDSITVLKVYSKAA